MRLKHQEFVELTKRAFVDSLAYAEVFPASWLAGYTRPDAFIVQWSSVGREHIEGKQEWIGSYDRHYIIECKVSPEDALRAPFQLLMSLVSIGRFRDLDFAHGGVSPVLAIPPNLRHGLIEAKRYNDLLAVFKELRFGVAIIRQEEPRIEWAISPGNFRA